jgi:quercetin dioxygenase-like cupin family protein
MSDGNSLQSPKNVQHLDKATLIRFEEATRFLWGDEESGRVSDWVYGSGKRIAAFMFSLRPGAYFRHSRQFKTYYEQQRLYYVYQGQITIHNPESGQVAEAQQGQAIFWQGQKWHYGYNFGDSETLILEAVVPPETAPEVTLSNHKPELKDGVNGRYDLLGNWPAQMKEAQKEAIRAGEMITLDRQDSLHLIGGRKSPYQVSLFVSTDELSAGTIELGIGKMCEDETHPGDEALVVTSGRLNVYLPRSHDWFELHPKDSLFIPEGVAHQYCNMSDERLAFFFAVAPKYR